MPVHLVSGIGMVSWGLTILGIFILSRVDFHILPYKKSKAPSPSPAKFPGPNSCHAWKNLKSHLLFQLPPSKLIAWGIHLLKRKTNTEIHVEYYQVVVRLVIYSDQQLMKEWEMAKTEVVIVIKIIGKRCFSTPDALQSGWAWQK